MSEAADCVHAGHRRRREPHRHLRLLRQGRVRGDARRRAARAGWREKVNICTKAGRLDRAAFDFTAARHAALRRGVAEALRTDHVEILLAHDIEFADDYERVFTETADVLHH